MPSFAIYLISTLTYRSSLISIYDDNPDKIGVPIGGIEQTPSNKVEGHIFVGSKSPLKLGEPSIMKIGVKFNQLTYDGYLQVIEYHQKYTDFNTLGLYRSIIENEKLDLVQKIAIRDLAHTKFLKTFEFLQLKDPYTYIKVSTIGEILTKADERQLWQNIRTNQAKILKDKRIKHRNFGNYAKHDCGYDDCPYNGVMIRQGGFLSESTIRFDSDNHRWARELKARRDAAATRNFRDNQVERADELTADRP